MIGTWNLQRWLHFQIFKFSFWHKFTSKRHMLFPIGANNGILFVGLEVYCNTLSPGCFQSKCISCLRWGLLWEHLAPRALLDVKTYQNFFKECFLWSPPCATEFFLKIKIRGECFAFGRQRWLNDCTNMVTYKQRKTMYTNKDENPSPKSTRHVEANVNTQKKNQNDQTEKTKPFETH